MGQTWDWHFNPAYEEDFGGTGSWTQVVDSFTPGAGRADWVQITDTVYTLPDFDEYTYHMETVGYCDAGGGWITSQTSDIHYVYGGRETNSTSYTTYDTPLLVMPPALRVGDTWLVDNSGVSRVEGQPDVTFTLNTTYEATRSAAVEVPAGTYEVIELRTTTPESTFTYWVDRDIGSVKSDVSELLDYRP